jgi:hypothetical protein
MLLIDMPKKLERPVKAVNLRLDEEYYDKFVDFCNEQGWVVTRQIDRLLKEFLEDHGVITPEA